MNAALTARAATRDARVAVMTAHARPPVDPADAVQVRRATAAALVARYAVRRAADAQAAAARDRAARVHAAAATRTAGGAR